MGQAVKFVEMHSDPLSDYFTAWSLCPDGEMIETPSSWLQPVMVDEGKAMLKVLKPGSDERPGLDLLRYWDGDGAVRVYRASPGALVMERAQGKRSLIDLALEGNDLKAANILTNVLRRLHEPKAAAPPDTLTPLQDRFADLLEPCHDNPILARSAAAARRLLRDQRDVTILHGDLHHGNVLDGKERGWLAIDPKGVVGERAYDVANLLCNPYPHVGLVLDPDRMDRLARFYGKCLDLDHDRVLEFAFAHAGLSLCWDLEDGGDLTYRRGCLHLLADLVKS
ncbi:MAG: aminoglycoside phosphotransferase family protein [Pseudomonadota bacterium]